MLDRTETRQLAIFSVFTDDFGGRIMLFIAMTWSNRSYSALGSTQS